MRSGALVLKSISIFLASGRNVKSAAQKSKKKKIKMNEKENKGGKISPKLLDALKRDTRFTRVEVEALYKIYRNLISMNQRCKASHENIATAAPIMRKPTTLQEGVNRTLFYELLHNTFDIVTEDIIMDRIFCVWDKDNAGLLTAEAWFKGLSVFVRGTHQERIDFCFSVYDLNVDGFISKDEIFQLLKNCLIKHPLEDDPDEGAKDLAEIVMRKLDKDKDGKVSLADYRESIKDEPLLVEVFGKCLPSERAKVTFLSTLKPITADARAGALSNSLS